MDRIETTTVGEAMRGERSFIEVPPTMETVTRSPEAQDCIDGTALRRLREAMPKDWKWQLGPEFYGEPSPVVLVFAGPEWDNDRDFEWPYEGTGDTIAEAADACREALKVHA